VATRFHSELLSTNEVTVVSGQQGQKFAIDSIWIANAHSSGVATTIRHVPFNQTSSASYNLYSAVSIAANTTVVIDDPIYLLSGDKLTAFAATADKISMVVYGREIR